MKKFLLSVAVVFTATISSYGQRSIDWSVDEVISPTNVEHKKRINLHMVCKNLGPDSAIAGDSIYWRILINNGQLTSGFSFKVLNRTLLTGDTIHVKLSYDSVNVTGFSFRSTFIAQSLLQNRPGLKLETQNTAVNNAKSVTIDYINDKGWGVGIADVAAANSLFSVYPNPATDNINVSLKLVGTSEPTEISLMDITGKTVYTTTTNSQLGANISTESLEKGIYIVRVKNGSAVSTAKITVQ